MQGPVWPVPDRKPSYVGTIWEEALEDIVSGILSESQGGKSAGSERRAPRLTTINTSNALQKCVESPAIFSGSTLIDRLSKVVELFK